MDRQLPVVDIAGTAFYVDVLREELRQTDDGENRISFNEIKEGKYGYHFLYDPLKKNVPEQALENEPATGQCLQVTLPALMELDPEAIATKYDIPLDILLSDQQTGAVIIATVKPLSQTHHDAK